MRRWARATLYSGKAADLIHTDRDLLRVKPSEIAETQTADQLDHVCGRRLRRRCPRRWLGYLDTPAHDDFESGQTDQFYYTPPNLDL